MKTRRLLLLGLLTALTTGAWADRVVTPTQYLEFKGENPSPIQAAVLAFLREETNRSALENYSNRLTVTDNDFSSAFAGLNIYYLGGKNGTEGGYLTYTVANGEAVTMQDNFEPADADLNNYNDKYLKGMELQSNSYPVNATVDFHLTKNGELLQDSRSHHVIVFTLDDEQYSAYSDIIFIACDVDGDGMYNDRVFMIEPAQSDYLSANEAFSNDKVLFLANSASNATEISNASGKVCNVTLGGRALYRDGNWNTLCLPFNLSETELANNNCPLKGATIMTLTDSSNNSFDESTGTLTIDFKTMTEMKAGYAYLVKWANGTSSTSPISNPTFWDVTVNSTTGNFNPSYVEFIGITSPLNIYDEQKTKLYLGEDNTLYYPTDPNFTVNSFRGYFQLKDGLTAGTPTTSGETPVRAFSLDFGDGTTGITTTNFTNDTNSSEEWYTIDGRKIVNSKSVNSQLPKGLYIHQGKKIIIK